MAVGQRHEKYQAFFTDWGMSRYKRQLGAILGIDIGLAALYHVEDLRDTVGQLQSWSEFTGEDHGVCH